MECVRRALIALVLTAVVTHLLYLALWKPFSAPSLLNLNTEQTASNLLPIIKLTRAIHHENIRNDSCVIPVPAGGFRAWKQDAATVLEPPIARNCTKLFTGNTRAIRRIKHVSQRWQNALNDSVLLNLTSNCSWVADYFSDNLYATKLERSFPIAYSFVIYNQPQQFLRLFRFLYKPFNTYCIHPDKKSPPLFHGIINNIAKCLQNMFIASTLISVQHSQPSLLEAQMSCMADLVKLRGIQSEEVRWNYVINLCGKELPLASPHEIVTHLKRAEGSSVIRAHKVKQRVHERVTVSRLHGREIPHNLQLYKGLAYMAISYQFANFLLTNETAIEVHEFFKTCDIPEEHFYSTLYMVPGVPGGFNESIPSDFFKVIEVLWVYDNRCLQSPKTRAYRCGWPWSRGCAGKIVHGICIVTSGSLVTVMAKSRDGRVALFHNKYFMEQDHVVMDCMEER